MTVTKGSLNNELETLLEVSLAKDSQGALSHYQSCLENIATGMLTRFDLCVNENRYTLLDVEAYLTAPNHHHADPYCHSHPLQFRKGYWFFHHVGMSKGFRGGSRKGVDITIGHPDHRSAGGMLIRAIMDQKDGRVIDGPCLVVDEILKILDYKSIKALVEHQWTGGNGLSWEKKSGFYLEAKKSNNLGKKRSKKRSKPEAEVYRCCRAGLGLSNKSPSIEERLSYVGRPYRFVLHPELVQKERVWVIFHMLDEGVGEEQIQQVTRTKKSIVNTYNTEYHFGKTHPIQVLRECLKGKDIIKGGGPWKIRSMSAIRWWNNNAKEGQQISSLI